MDRTRSSSTEYCSPVPPGGLVSLDLLPRTHLRERAKSAIAAALGRTLHRISVLRQPADAGGLAAGLCLSDQPQAHPPTDERARAGSDLSQAEVEPTGPRPSGLSLSTSRCANRARQSGLEQRYYLYPHAGGLRVSGSGDRLVQPVCTQLGDIEHRRRLAQSRGSGRRLIRSSKTRDLQHRSRIAIYQSTVSGATDRSPDRHQHGWPRPCFRQCLYRKTLAHRQIRARLSARVLDVGRVANGPGEILSALQFSPSASSSAVSHSSRSVLPGQAETRKGSCLTWGSAPNPGIYRCFPPEWIFSYWQKPACPLQSSCLIGRQGDAGMRPERRIKPGMDGGSAPSPYTRPPQIRMAEKLSNEWGPPQPSLIMPGIII